ncbi:DUF3644 domain-containing protein [Heliobacterium chlorum]|uniref:DUF3644 domain-containing protein n=1 Tax=Heliobacterium chlorum TaxID=2698 RepID=A0ABR7T431_HELCL|nr:DUF3644 domain-containing protein [Heliobacterium chlorum]MBC9785524.1 DUF3644 domain-containing protein [Heliobacterium chlorum]
MRRLPKKAEQLVNKAREACILAVEIYNKPGISFRSGGFIVLMIIAWTSLFHAIFEKNKLKYYYKDNNNKRLYQKVDGDYKAWEISKCLSEYYKTENNAIKQNLEFLIGLRNKIEHRFMPKLDNQIFGECQANLINFEEILIKEFGVRYALNESLVFALQFSKLRTTGQNEASRKIQSAEYQLVDEYIREFKQRLPEPILQSMDYCFRVFLIPKIANRSKNSDASVEFVQYDPNKPEEMQQYEKFVALIKEKQVPVLNPGLLKPKDVANKVSKTLGINFSHNNHHSKCWKYYNVRPPIKDNNPAKTDTKYCQYDAAHNDYLYTEEWVKLLITELSDENKRFEILNSQ